MNDEPRQKLNEKKKHKFHPKIRSRDSQKKKNSRQEPNGPSLDPPQKRKKKTQNKTKTGQAQLHTYLPSGKTRTRPSTIITRLQQSRYDQQQQRQKLKQLVLH
jgi:hypothetical protein